MRTWLTRLIVVAAVLTMLEIVAPALSFSVPKLLWNKSQSWASSSWQHLRAMTIKAHAQASATMRTARPNSPVAKVGRQQFETNDRQAAAPQSQERPPLFNSLNNSDTASR